MFSAGLPRHTENMEFRTSFSSDRENTEIFPKQLKICFYTGYLPQTREILKLLKKKYVTLVGNGGGGIWLKTRMWGKCGKFCFYQSDIYLKHGKF